MIDFSTAVGKKGIASFDERLNFFKKHRLPTANICLIERAADNLINFPTVVKKRLSKFELLKYCRVSHFSTAVTDRLHKQQELS